VCKKNYIFTNLGYWPPHPWTKHGPQTVVNPGGSDILCAGVLTHTQQVTHIDPWGFCGTSYPPAVVSLSSSEYLIASSTIGPQWSSHQCAFMCYLPLSKLRDSRLVGGSFLLKRSKGVGNGYDSKQKASPSAWKPKVVIVSKGYKKHTTEGRCNFWDKHCYLIYRWACKIHNRARWYGMMKIWDGVER
jgi:hypothetical protein